MRHIGVGFQNTTGLEVKSTRGEEQGMGVTMGLCDRGMILPGGGSATGCAWGNPDHRWNEFSFGGGKTRMVQPGGWVETRLRDAGEGRETPRPLHVSIQTDVSWTELRLEPGEWGGQTISGFGVERGPPKCLNGTKTTRCGGQGIGVTTRSDRSEKALVFARKASAGPDMNLS